MEVVNVGRRVRCEEIRAGVEGTIVRSEVRRHLTGKSTVYDVLWDDGACTRALSAAELGRSQWLALPEIRSAEHCNQLWYQHLLSQARSRAHNAAGNTASLVEQTPAAQRPVAAAAGRPRAARESVPLSRPATPSVLVRGAQELLARQHVGLEVGVSASRRVNGHFLQIAWADGPATGNMFRYLAQMKDEGLVKRIELLRWASEPMLATVLRFINEQFYSSAELAAPRPALGRVLAKVTPQAYLHGELTCVYPPPGHPHSSLSYHQLVRCVFERWDDHLGRFCDTPSCRYLVQEQAALFPRGDVLANQRMRELLLAPASSEHAPDEDTAEPPRLRA